MSGPRRSYYARGRFHLFAVSSPGSEREQEVGWGTSDTVEEGVALLEQEVPARWYQQWRVWDRETGTVVARGAPTSAVEIPRIPDDGKPSRGGHDLLPEWNTITEALNQWMQAMPPNERREQARYTSRFRQLGTVNLAERRETVRILEPLYRAACEQRGERAVL